MMDRELLGKKLALATNKAVASDLPLQWRNVNGAFNSFISWI